MKTIRRIMEALELIVELLRAINSSKERRDKEREE